MCRAVKLLFKFDQKATDSEIQGVMKGLSKAGASRVYPVFKGTKDPELAKVYGVRCAKPRAANIQGILDDSTAVEYSEAMPVRRMSQMG